MKNEMERQTKLIYKEEDSVIEFTFNSDIPLDKMVENMECFLKEIGRAHV